MVMPQKAEFFGEIISGYRVTIPKNIRRLMKIAEGDLVKITLEKMKEEET